MEEIIDMETWAETFEVPEIEYLAVFDPIDGRIKAVGPKVAFANEKHKVPMDRETAELIIEGKILINSCSVDVSGNTVSISESRALYKIDDVLHRIIEKEHADFEKPDVFLSYNRKKKQLTVELTEEFYGTKKLNKKFHPIKKKRVNWAGTTEMNFLITDYNDPNVLHRIFSLTVSDLVENKTVIADLDLPEKFSVYTRRLFKNYVMEHK